MLGGVALRCYRVRRPVWAGHAWTALISKTPNRFQGQLSTSPDHDGAAKSPGGRFTISLADVDHPCPQLHQEG
jgi:hypothetical protein